MSKKGENIYKRKDGRWEARYEKCRAVSGKIVYGYCYGKTYKETKQKMQNARAQASLNSRAQKDVDRFQCFCDGWLSEKAVTIKQSSYLWAVKRDDVDVYGFCFRSALYLLDSCYRKGNLDNDQYKAELIDMIGKHCRDAAPSVISDLYRAALAFAMCHALAHIYHSHHEIQTDDKAVKGHIYQIKSWQKVGTFASAPVTKKTKSLESSMFSRLF